MTVLVVGLFVAVIAVCAAVIVVVQARSSEAQSRRRMAAVAALTRAYVAEQTAGLERLVVAYGDRLTVAGTLEPGASAVERRAVEVDLARLREARPDVAVAFLTDSSGVLLGSSPESPDTVGRSYAYRDWFQGAMRSPGRPYLSEVYQSAAAWRPLVVAASVVVRGRPPAGGGPGPVRGALAVSFPLSSFQRFVDDYAADTGIRLVIVDQRGVLVAAGADRAVGSDGLEARREAGRRALARDGAVAAVVTDSVTGWRVSAQIPVHEARSWATAWWVIATAALTVLVVIGAAAVAARLRRSERRSRAEVERSREEIEQFFRVSVDLLCIASFDGYFKRVNPAWQTVLGYSEQELLAEPFMSFVHPDDVAATVAQSRKLAAGTVALGFENRYRCRDGTYRWLMWQVAPLPERGMLYAVASDITERKAAELASAQLAAIVDSSVDAIIGAGLDGVVTSWNHGAERMFGYPPEQIIGRPIRLLSPPEHEEQDEKLARAARGEIVAPYEATRVRSDGVAIEVALTKSPVQGPDGSVVGVALIARDITDTKRSADALRAIIESASDAFISIDSNGAVTEWNHRAETLFGRRRAEVIGRDLADLVIPDRTKEAHRTGVANAFRGGGAGILDRTRQITAMARDGVEFPAEITVWPVSASGGDQFSAFVRDVSQRQQFERDLAEARDRALEASRLKSEFMAMMSHEIRTPMNGVIGLTGLLLRGELNDTARGHAQRIRSAGKALLTVLNDILDFSKIEAGALVIDDSPASLKAIVEEVLELVAESARSKGLELIGHCDPMLPDVVRGDPVRIRQILLNFAVNAVKFTERGEVFIHVRRHPDVSASGPAAIVDVRLEVTDTGIGIAPEHIVRMFDAFAQADSSTTRRFGGTGLGLAICRELAEAMGGEIGVHSRPGAGSVFWCRLPLRQGPTVSHADTTALKGLRLLAVDDNATSRRVLAEQSCAWGMLPTAVASAGEAIDHLRAADAHRRPFDVLITDLHMPDRDGLYLAAQINDDPGIPALPVVVMSEENLAMPEEAAHDSGIVAVLTKPIQQSQLYDCLVDIATAGRTPPPRLPPATTPAPAPPVADGPRLLLAEDNETNQIVAVGFLEELGYRVDVAGDGAQALDMLGKHRYQAVIMDCQMPAVDGYQAATEIRRREREHAGVVPRHLPIIAMTAAAFKDDRERCYAAGMDDYLTKPFEAEDLATAIHRWVPDPTRPHPASTSGVAADDQLPGDHDIGRRFAVLRDHLPPGSIDRLVAAFVGDGRTCLDNLRAATERADPDAVARTAHTLRGAASSINATAIAALSRSLEDRATTGDLHGAAETTDRLETAYRHTCGVLQAFTTRPDPQRSANSSNH